MTLLILLVGGMLVSLHLFGLFGVCILHRYVIGTMFVISIPMAVYIYKENN